MHQNDLGDIENENQWNYISVIFENKYYPFNDPRVVKDSKFRNDVYGNATQYTYKTKNNYRVGQVLSIDQNQKGYSRVLVVNPRVLKEDITYDIKKIKELPTIY